MISKVSQCFYQLCHACCIYKAQYMSYYIKCGSYRLSESGDLTALYFALCT